MKSAHQFPAILNDLEINTDKLGCLMLETENPGIDLPGAVPYTSPNPDRTWIKGISTDWHVTVRYGFLPEVKADHIQQIVDVCAKPQHLIVHNVDIFKSPYEDENYECIVASVHSDKLFDLNKQLSVLPNISTFPEYKPHVTLGYVEKGWWDAYGHQIFMYTGKFVTTGRYILGKTYGDRALSNN